jgi:recombination DNA repair RAD52 pathway protein
MDPLSPEEELRRRLNQPLNPAIVSTRPGPGGHKVKYVAGEVLFHEANRLRTDWSSKVIEIRCARDRLRPPQPA